MSDEIGASSFLGNLTNMISKDLVKWSCGVGAVAFLGYSIYFDYCRTHAPDYKEKIRESKR
jgi:hypothetical protein